MHRNLPTESVKVLGIDTEAYTTGKCFMIATSLGDVFTLENVPNIFFTRKYRNSTFVAYNLKYDEGAFLQNLPYENLQELRETLKTKHDDYIYSIIPRKVLIIRRGKNSVTFYDLASFFKATLEKASSELLGEHKKDIETKSFSKAYVKKNWGTIAEYCIQDAVLVKRLADNLIKRFEGFGIFPRRLYSTAYISYQYFYTTCKYPVVKRYWNYYRNVLKYALLSYNGGKFEVTEKGLGYFYEYDVNSQYPNYIANLTDMSESVVIESSTYVKEAQYGFIKCLIDIPIETFNPTAIKKGMVNTFPCGVMEKVITKVEYDYLVAQGVEIEIINAWWLYAKKIVYPFRKEILKLTKLKNEIKHKGNKIDYHIIKILLNSLYGKFVQLIETKDCYKASTCWNPIFGTYITAQGRIQVTELQQKYEDIIAVHTDSVISKIKLPLYNKGMLGEFEFETEGEGIILGSGIYQIGDKNKFRGFDSKTSIIDIVKNMKSKGTLTVKRPLTWREVVFHGWELDRINRFEEITKELNVNFDQKRFWVNDWESFSDVLENNVYSVPLVVDSVMGI